MRQLIRKLYLYGSTIRYLKPRQILWRIWYRITCWPTAHQIARSTASTLAKIEGWQSSIAKPQSHFPDASFQFLNCRVHFPDAIDWEHDSQGRLWTYNLHYFDFLNTAPQTTGSEPSSLDDTGKCLILNWIDNNPPTKGTGWEPYPTSLRIVNWIKWSLNGHSLCPVALASLHIQARWLFHRIEHHILANHLLTNIKALCFAGFFFDNPEAALWRHKALTLLERELDEQIMADGAHFELSPMYHDIILEDVLDLINLLRSQKVEVNKTRESKICEIAKRMTEWSLQIRHPDHQIAFFNDAAFAIAPSIDSLLAYAARLSIRTIAIQSDFSKICDEIDSLRAFKDSGLVVLRKGVGFAIFDAGPIGPTYQPGHAHADSLSFEYSWGNERVLVNSGTSTYTPGDLRNSQRSTRLHNTLEIDGRNSSEVWGGFRVAGRAQAQLLELGRADRDAHLFALACHNGYARLNRPTIHTRKLQLGAGSLQIEDWISGKWNQAIARFHLHPSISLDGTDKLVCSSGQVFKLAITGGNLKQCNSTWYPEFGIGMATQCLELSFDRNHSGPYRFQLIAI